MKSKVQVCRAIGEEMKGLRAKARCALASLREHPNDAVVARECLRETTARLTMGVELQMRHRDEKEK